MAKFRAKVTGLKRAQKKMDNYVTRNDRANLRGTVKTLLLIKKVSVKGTPRRVGNLANSAFVTMPTGPVGASGSFKGDDASKLSGDHSAMLSKISARARRRSRRGRIVGGVGHSARYARVVHENPAAGAAGFGGEADQTDENFNRLRAEDVHSAVGGWKFLDKAVIAIGPQHPKFIAAEMRASR